jgi:hypothetical protein
MQLGQHPRAIGARVLTEDEDRLGSGEVVEQHVPLPIPMLSGRPTLVGSWHIFEQSGKLFVPKRRANLVHERRLVRGASRGVELGLVRVVESVQFAAYQCERLIPRPTTYYPGTAV